MATIHKIDATDQPLGRLASRVAVILRGKDNPNFQLHILPNNRVIVYNTNKVKLTGKKMEQKKYFRYSGYPGGLKEENLKDVFRKDSKLVVKRAVWGMLPKNKLRKKIIQNLKLYKEEIKE